MHPHIGPSGLEWVHNNIELYSTTASYVLGSGSGYLCVNYRKRKAIMALALKKEGLTSKKVSCLFNIIKETL